ncbi:helix-turn-helix transcriptional regulator [uncultured Desulfuromusa sp.]|uniref:helix-turn-helix domain-containing protein n=1 Tax=uncultured Desulfuromusa sp. TaxID=219183 RepID=UPI002AA7B649|nr:helix-turn-helix transcriptional regulator [uncultured Desulfuromusa sp.]
MVETVIAKNMKVVMAEKNMRNVDLYRKTSVPMSRIGDILRGRVLNPRINTMVSLADGLGVTIDSLVKDKEVVNS